MSNRLAGENSPYLLQHAENPVDWYPWGEEAFELARKRDLPVFLSIGYAACHWCHVMAHESFEDQQVAEKLNKYFVNIKVDREERPDIDQIYMNAVVAMTGQGGWPLSVFLTPEGHPFFGGTYYPPIRRYQMPSFTEIIESIHRVWQNDRQRVVESSAEISEHLKRQRNVTDKRELPPDALDRATLTMAQGYDWKHGGWGKAPKFPQAMAIEFLLIRAASGDTLARDMSLHALDAMSRGGMYDMIGGGFARYSTDDNWLVPHFEKMLYDNALLARAYLHAYLLTGEAHYRQVCTETLDFVAREMTSDEGGFYSSLDADSEGEEGKYYSWTLNEIQRLLPPDDAELMIAAYGLSEEGNFEGANVLQRRLDEQALAEQFKLPPKEVIRRLENIHLQLLEHRGQRVPPALDDKVLVAWNGLMSVVFAEAGRYLGLNQYNILAMRNIKFMIENLHSDGRLLRAWRAGTARHNAYLEDHASLILALLAVYQSDFDVSWFIEARRLTQELLAHFSDPSDGFFDTRDDHEELVLRPKDLQDNATPSGNALAATALLLMAAFTGNLEWRDKAAGIIESVAPVAQRYPTAFGQWLCAIHLLQNPVQEIAVLGDLNNRRTQDLISTVWSRFRPGAILAASPLPIPPQAPELLVGRSLLQSAPTAFVCQNFICQVPVNQTEDLKRALGDTP